MNFLEAELADLDRRHLRRGLRRHRECPGRYVEVSGEKLLNFSSNNYLGLAGHPALADGAQRSLVAGAGSTASRLVTGNLEMHEALESDIAALHGLPAARLFGSGYQANLGLLSCLAGKDDLVVSDRLNHASIIDGIRLSRAQCRIADHCSLGSFRSHLETGGVFRRRFVVTDSVFSMDGDSPDLVGLRALCDEFDAFLIVDEAHATGCLHAGAGLCSEFGVRPDALTGGLGKALGGYGGYVAGSFALTDLLLNRARSFVFSTALPPAVLGSAQAAIELIQSKEGRSRRKVLSGHIRHLSAGLLGLGRLEQGAGRSPIFPILVGGAEEAINLAATLQESGLFCQAIRPPTVAPGSSRLRIALSSELEPRDIERLLMVLAESLG